MLSYRHFEIAGAGTHYIVLDVILESRSELSDYPSITLKLFHTVLSSLQGTLSTYARKLSLPNFSALLAVARECRVETEEHRYRREGFASPEVVLFTIKVRLIVPEEVDGNEQLCRHRNVNCRTRRDLTRFEIKAHAGFVYLATNELTHNLNR